MQQISLLGGSGSNLGNWFTDIFAPVATSGSSTDSQEQIDCVNSANAQSAALDAKISDLAKNWNPTGFYSPEQLTQVITQVSSVLTQARSAVLSTQEQTSGGADSDIATALDDIQGANSKGQPFVDAIKAAQASGVTTIDAPGLKRWATNSLNDASGAFNTASVVLCRRNWGGLADLIAAFGRVLDGVINVLKTILGVVADVGKAVIKVAETLWGLPTWAWKAIGWTIAIGGALYLGHRVYTRRYVTLVP